MKAVDVTNHSVPDVSTTVDTAAPAASHAAPTEVEVVYAQYREFVWASLQRLGARHPDLQDLFQEVFIVVHQRLKDFEGRSTLKTWLFGICLRVVAAHRRRAVVRRELPTDNVSDLAPASTDRDPEQDAVHTQARDQLTEILDQMDLEKRSVLVMYEIEEMQCDEIAVVMGIPIGTVYSRLHTARAQFEAIRSGQRSKKSVRGER